MLVLLEVMSTNCPVLAVRRTFEAMCSKFANSPAPNTAEVDVTSNPVPVVRPSAERRIRPSPALTPAVVAESATRLKRAPVVNMVPLEVTDSPVPVVKELATIDCAVPVSAVVERYNPVPLVNAPAENTKADDAVPVVATDDVKVWEPVPDVRASEVVVALFPIVMVFAEAPVARFTAPVVPESRVKAAAPPELIVKAAPAPESDHTDVAAPVRVRATSELTVVAFRVTTAFAIPPVNTASASASTPTEIILKNLVLIYVCFFIYVNLLSPALITYYASINNER